MLYEPTPSPGELHFSLFGIPVRVHPFFWLIGLVLGPLTRAGLPENLAWITAFFIGILLHELGHAAVLRALGHQPWIVLYGFGGLTGHGPQTAFRRFGPPWVREILISAAGPAAGFLLAGAIVVALLASGRTVIMHVVFWPLMFPEFDPHGLPPLFAEFLYDLLFVTIAYGILNLLPVLPLDGGQIARSVLTRIDPRGGLRKALVLSVVVAVVVAVAAVAKLGLNDALFLALLFGWLAVNNYQALQYQ